MNASDLFVQALENEGVEIIYGVPGEENLDFLEAMRTSNIELVLTRHEQSAAFMAATYGRLTGKVGVCLATLGPGATNLVTGAAYAQLGGFPMMMITGQKPIKKSKQGQFQIVDIVDMMKPITKYTRQIVNVNMIPSMVRESFRLAQEERPGAVHLELPEDIAAEEVNAKTIPIFEISRRRYPHADRAILDEAAEMIKSAKHPLLLIGAGANRARIWEALSNFVTDTDIPFVNTQMGKGVICGHSEKYLGTAALSDSDYVHYAIDKADLIINVGHDVVEKPPFFMEHGGVKVIHVNFKTAIVDNVYFPQIEVVGDIATSMARLANRVGKTGNYDFSYFMKVRDHVIEQISKNNDVDSFPMKPQRFVADVRKAMPEDGIIALDNGVYKVWFARHYRTTQPNTVLLDNALATMGAGLPSAMEAARLYPSRRVMAICGDGGFMMNSQEMETAIRLSLNLVVLILNDSSYGMIRWKQYGMGFEDYALEFNNPDFVMYANSYGAKGHRVESAESFVPLINQCFDEGGVHLIDLPVDYSENTKVLIDELKNKDGSL
ncbi:acetolactate synthase [Candidatus Endobugula sertula]|uniref:Acetolactate synthase n=1 Tax=Candidatus Endobugula sertula TaxID=62101 RepID=A0A1D2QRK9_9GAMM|nr:acetolactate synthase [Candidatus Endobugula sertula]